MKTLCLLLSPGLIGIKNRLIRSGSSGRKKTILMGLLGIAFWVGMFLISCRVLKYFQSIEMIGDLLARHLLTMLLLTIFSLLIFSSVISALSNLYLSDDLELCLSTPVSIEEIFLSRVILTFINSTWMILIFSMPVFFAYGYVYASGAGFYFTFLHMIVAMAMIASGVGIFLTMALVHIIPAQRTRDIILLLSIVMVIALYFLFRFLRPERLVDPEAFFSVVQYMGALKAPDSPYLPTRWIGKTIWGSLRPSVGQGYFFEIALSWTTALSVMVINTWMANLVYFSGFSKSREARKRRSGGKRVLAFFAGACARPFGDEVGAVISKDIKVFFRDNTQWTQLLLLGALVIVYVYNFSVLPLHKSPIPLDFLQNELAFLNMGLAGFVLSAVCARFVFTAVSAEGKAYWIIRTSPLNIKRYLWGKYFLFLSPMLLLGEALVVLTNYYLNVTSFMMVLSAATMFLLTFSIVSMAMGFGAIYPRFKHENIAQVSMGFGGLSYMIVSAVLTGVVILIEAWPVYMIFMAQKKGVEISMGQWIFIVASFALALAILAAAVFKPMKKGFEALERYEG